YDNEKKEYLPSDYGRCDREVKCGYLLNPYQNGYSKQIWEEENGSRITGITQITLQKKLLKSKKQKTASNPVFFDFDTFKKTLKDYRKNGFIQNLLKNVDYPFSADDIEKM